MTRSVSSMTTQKSPWVCPSSPGAGLYENVWYVSSGKPCRSRKSKSPSSHVASPVDSTRSTRGPMVSQISAHTSLAGLPSAHGCFLPSVCSR